MAAEEDDKATVVLDLAALKREKERREKELASMPLDLEFSVPGLETHASSKAAPAAPVVFWEMGGRPFSPHKASFPAGMEYHFVASLPELNGWIKKKTPLVVVFQYESNPKAVNQLCAQLHLKFPWVKVIISSQSLTPEKQAVHAASPAKADAYVRYPVGSAEFLQAIQMLTSQQAA